MPGSIISMNPKSALFFGHCRHILLFIEQLVYYIAWTCPKALLIDQISKIMLLISWLWHSSLNNKRPTSRSQQSIIAVCFTWCTRLVQGLHCNQEKAVDLRRLKFRGRYREWKNYASRSSPMGSVWSNSFIIKNSRYPGPHLIQSLLHYLQAFMPILLTINLDSRRKRQSRSTWAITSFQRWTLSTAITSHSQGNFDSLIAQGLQGPRYPQLWMTCLFGDLHYD